MYSFTSVTHPKLAVLGKFYLFLLQKYLIKTALKSLISYIQIHRHFHKLDFNSK
jgi:hypothetical protein